MEDEATEAGGRRKGGDRELVQSHRRFISELQEAVLQASTTGSIEDGRFVSRPTDDLRSRVDAANEAIRQAAGRPRTRPELRLGSEEGNGEDEIRLRVTCPTDTVVWAIASELPDEPTQVEFYRTRSDADGTVDTQLLGIAKHPDSKGRHNVRFRTERFATRPDENVIIHGELVDASGFLLAAHGLPVID